MKLYVQAELQEMARQVHEMCPGSSRADAGWAVLCAYFGWEGDPETPKEVVQAVSLLGIVSRTDRLGHRRIRSRVRKDGGMATQGED